MSKSSRELTAKDLQHYRRKLLQHLSDRLGDIYDFQEEEEDIESTRVPRDLADLGSESQQSDMLRELEENEREEALEIVAALERIERGTYGICERTDRPIPKNRLEAIPWTRYTIDAAREVEQQSPR